MSIGSSRRILKMRGVTLTFCFPEKIKSKIRKKTRHLLVSREFVRLTKVIEKRRKTLPYSKTLSLWGLEQSTCL